MSHTILSKPRTRAFHRARVAVLLSVAILGGCGSSPSSEDLKALREDVAQIRALQESMARSIADLQKAASAPQAASVPPVASAPPAASAGPGTPAAAPERPRIPVQYSPRKGDPDAPVTVVEFIDFQCAFSQAAAHVPDQLVREFPGKVQVAFKNAPLNRHRDATTAAKAAWAAARQDKFWQMHDKIFAGDIREISVEQLRSYAGEIGLDLERFDRDMNSPQAARGIGFDKMLSKSLKIAGTPSYYVNGRAAPDPRIETIRRMINEELAAAAKG